MLNRIGTSDRKYMKNAYIIFTIIICAFFLPACLHTRTRPFGLEPQAKVVEKKKYRILGESEAQSSSFNLFWLFPVTSRINYDKAVTDAISNLRGDNLIEVHTWLERQIWIVGMVEILHVKGKVIQYQK